MFHELPIRSKLEIAGDIPRILYYLHNGKRGLALPLMEDMKIRSIFLEDSIQQSALAFISQVLFQFDYDPWHKVTPEVQKAADRLIEEMGFQAPSEEEDEEIAL